jgi:hypothetical protein
MSLDLDDSEKAALIELLSDTIERDRFPLPPRPPDAGASRQSSGSAQPRPRRTRR